MESASADSPIQANTGQSDFKSTSLGFRQASVLRVQPGCSLAAVRPNLTLDVLGLSADANPVIR